jgi:predicted nucleic acid-binding protein
VARPSRKRTDHRRGDLHGRRLGGKAVLERAQAATKGLTLIPVSVEIIKLASDPHTSPLRAMDAIHLATALTVRNDVAAMFVYDGELRLLSARSGTGEVDHQMVRKGSADHVR